MVPVKDRCGTGGARAWRGLASLAAVVGLILAFGMLRLGGASDELLAAESSAEPRLGSAREALAEWVSLQRTISEERDEWRLTREILHERIAMIERQNERLEKDIEAAEAKLSEKKTRRAELESENKRLKGVSTALEDAVARYEGRLRGLLQRLPAPLVEDVKPLRQRLPEEGEEIELSLGERYQNVIGILNQIDKFNTAVTKEVEAREVGDGRTVQVNTLYVGVGQGFYVDKNGTLAGIGTSRDGSWTWIPANDAAKAIQEAIAILENQKPASFVRLPVEAR